ncbi:MAG: amidohydrolase family protein, partial [bacterium]|nr:amidohydrolase family protein [bacterium]
AEAIVAASVCENIYVELSSLMPHHIEEVLAHVPANRLMMGSDLPVSLEAELVKILNLDIAADDKREILSGTAAKLLG